MEKTIFTQLTSEQLQAAITEAVSLAISRNKVDTSNPFEDVNYITRKDAAKILGCSLVSLNQWTKSGIIQGYRIGTRVRYKKIEVLNSLVKVKSGRV